MDHIGSSLEMTVYTIFLTWCVSFALECPCIGFETGSNMGKKINGKVYVLYEMHYLLLP